MPSISFARFSPLFFLTEASKLFEIKIHFLEYTELILIKMLVRVKGICQPWENRRSILFFKGHGEKLKYP